MFFISMCITKLSTKKEVLFSETLSQETQKNNNYSIFSHYIQHFSNALSYVLLARVVKLLILLVASISSTRLGLYSPSSPVGWTFFLCLGLFQANPPPPSPCSAERIAKVLTRTHSTSQPHLFGREIDTRFNLGNSLSEGYEVDRWRKPVWML